MIDPKPKLRLWAMRCGYAFVLQFLVAWPLHYHQDSELLAIGFLTAHVWFAVTFLVTFWYSQQLVTYKFNKEKKT